MIKKIADDKMKSGNRNIDIKKSIIQTGKILISAIAGTSAMTLFSYLATETENKNFREPEILGHLIKQLPNKLSQEKAQVAGWGAHYGTGILFLALYNKLWKRTRMQPSLTTGSLLGAVSGLAGIAVWKVVFKVHPNPPAKNLKPFFSHLIFAHVVFGIFSALTYRATDAHKKT